VSRRSRHGGSAVHRPPLSECGPALNQATVDRPAATDCGVTDLAVL